MKLSKVTIVGFRSIREEIILHVDPQITIVLGANDHGKSNLLKALTHLNPDMKFTEDDQSWDLVDSAKYPRIEAIFTLTELERRELWKLQLEENQGGSPDSIKDPGKTLPVDAAHTSEEQDEESSNDSEEEESEEGEVSGEEDVDGVEDEATSLPLDDSVAQELQREGEDKIDHQKGAATDAATQGSPQSQNLRLKDIGNEFSFVRMGVGNDYECYGLDSISSDVFWSWFNRKYPRFELIEPYNKVTDSADSASLKNGSNAFMRGIFYYAGLNPNEVGDLFQQNDRTAKLLEKASKKLNETLRKSWTQGKDLNFMLRHDSKNDSIDFMIEDESVSTRYTRASARSSGFTHYFALKTILHGRQQEHPAGSYIFLFDEPGIYLHPAGQHDMLQVLESLSHSSQILYVTHSLFMINRTFPKRHRLLVRTKDGTRLDGKPYQGRWARAMSALGMYLSGTVLFAEYVLFVEGDSDPIYLYALLQKLAQLGKIDLDLNQLAIVATGEAQQAEVLIRLIGESSNKPTMAHLFDGDDGGKMRLATLKDVCHSIGVKTIQLDKDVETEDHLPFPAAFVEAVVCYTEKLGQLNKMKAEDIQAAKNKVKEKMRLHLESASPGGISKTASNAIRSTLGLASDPSKLGIAREYAEALDTYNEFEKSSDLKKALALAMRIRSELNLPSTSTDEDFIVVSKSS